MAVHGRTRQSIAEQGLTGHGTAGHRDIRTGVGMVLMGKVWPVRAGDHVMGDDALYQCLCLSHCLWAEACAFAGTGRADDGVILT